MSEFVSDIRYASRLLVKSRGFAVLAVVALALGIGASTVVFSIINAVLLRPLPLEDSGRIVMVWSTRPEADQTRLIASVPDYLDWKEQNRVFERMAAIRVSREIGSSFVARDVPERIVVGRISADYLPLLGVQPVAGRNFLPEENKPGGDLVIMLSQGLAERYFGGASAAVGEAIRLDGRSYTVIGVVSPVTKQVSMGADALFPIRLDTNRWTRQMPFVAVMARLKPGVSLARAQAEMDRICGRLAEEYPESNRGKGAHVVSWTESISGGIGPMLWMLFLAVGMLVLIACANVANLLLARAAGRGQEVATRRALGAGNGRIVRQLLTEGALLALLGGVLGILLAAWSLEAVRDLMPGLVPRLQESSIDGRVLGFALLLSLLTTLTFGLVPALRVSRADLAATLKQGSGHGTLGASRQRHQSVLLAAQVALAMMMSVGAGMMARSFLRLLEVDLGLNTENTLVMTLALRADQYRNDADARRLFVERVLDRVENLPGVLSADVTNAAPLFDTSTGIRAWYQPFQVLGQPVSRRDEELMADVRTVTPGYFGTVRQPLRRGRLLTAHDNEDAPNVVIINEAMVQRVFPNQNPLGQRLIVSAGNSEMRKQPREIVGVVGDVKLYGIEEFAEPAVYLPHAQFPMGMLHLLVRCESDANALVEPVRRVVMAIDPEQAVGNQTTMAERLSGTMMPRRLSSTLFGVFAALALILAMIGLFGLVAYQVSLRTREFGLRMALGADRSNLSRLVLRNGISITIVGVTIGLAGGIAAAQLMRNLLFGVSATDLVVFTTVTVFLILVSALACYVPARRATKVDPMVALTGVPQLKQRINFFEGAETCYGRSDKKSVFCFQR